MNLNRIPIKAKLNIFFLMLLSSQINASNIKSNAFRYADKELNKSYQKIIKKLDYSDRIKLKQAQRQWIIFRDLDCTWAYKKKPLECFIKRTNNRTKEFQEFSFYSVKTGY